MNFGKKVEASLKARAISAHPFTIQQNEVLVKKLATTFQK